jgi:hypothetical protein
MPLPPPHSPGPRRLSTETPRIAEYRPAPTFVPRRTRHGITLRPHRQRAAGLWSRSRSPRIPSAAKGPNCHWKFRGESPGLLRAAALPTAALHPSAGRSGSAELRLYPDRRRDDEGGRKAVIQAPLLLVGIRSSHLSHGGEYRDTPTASSPSMPAPERIGFVCRLIRL